MAFSYPSQDTGMGFLSVPKKENVSSSPAVVSPMQPGDQAFPKENPFTSKSEPQFFGTESSRSQSSTDLEINPSNSNHKLKEPQHALEIPTISFCLDETAIEQPAQVNRGSESNLIVPSGIRINSPYSPPRSPYCLSSPISSPSIDYCMSPSSPLPLSPGGTKKLKYTLQQREKMKSIINSSKDAKISKGTIIALAEEFGLQAKSIKIWFQNYKARQKKKNYDTIETPVSTNVVSSNSFSDVPIISAGLADEPDYSQNKSNTVETSNEPTFEQNTPVYTTIVPAVKMEDQAIKSTPPKQKEHFMEPNESELIQKEPEPQPKPSFDQQENYSFKPAQPDGEPKYSSLIESYITNVKPIPTSLDAMQKEIIDVCTKIKAYGKRTMLPVVIPGKLPILVDALYSTSMCSELRRLVVIIISLARQLLPSQTIFDMIDYSKLSQAPTPSPASTIWLQYFCDQLRIHWPFDIYRVIDKSVMLPLLDLWRAILIKVCYAGNLVGADITVENMAMIPNAQLARNFIASSCIAMLSCDRETLSEPFPPQFNILNEIMVHSLASIFIRHYPLEKSTWVHLMKFTDDVQARKKKAVGEILKYSLEAPQTLSEMMKYMKEFNMLETLLDTVHFYMKQGAGVEDPETGSPSEMTLSPTTIGNLRVCSLWRAAAPHFPFKSLTVTEQVLRSCICPLVGAVSEKYLSFYPSAKEDCETYFSKKEGYRISQPERAFIERLRIELQNTEGLDAIDIHYYGAILAWFTTAKHVWDSIESMSSSSRKRLRSEAAETNAAGQQMTVYNLYNYSIPCRSFKDFVEWWRNLFLIQLQRTGYMVLIPLARELLQAGCEKWKNVNSLFFSLGESNESNRLYQYILSRITK